MLCEFANRISWRLTTTAKHFVLNRWMNTIAKWCYLIFRYIENDFVNRIKQQQQQQRHAFKAGFKKPFLVEIERELKHNQKKRRNQTVLACANVCLHLVFFKRARSSLTHWNEWHWNNSKKSPLAEKIVWRKMLNRNGFFCWLYGIYLSISFPVSNIFPNGRIGCLLDCLHLPKNMKWSVCIT